MNDKMILMIDFQILVNKFGFIACNNELRQEGLVAVLPQIKKNKFQSKVGIKCKGLKNC